VGRRDRRRAVAAGEERHDRSDSSGIPQDATREPRDAGTVPRFVNRKSRVQFSRGSDCGPLVARSISGACAAADAVRAPGPRDDGNAACAATHGLRFGYPARILVLW
jgi:hypothetical protein